MCMHEYNEPCLRPRDVKAIKKKKGGWLRLVWRASTGLFSGCVKSDEMRSVEEWEQSLTVKFDSKVEVRSKESCVFKSVLRRGRGEKEREKVQNVYGPVVASERAHHSYLFGGLWPFEPVCMFYICIFGAYLLVALFSSSRQCTFGPFLGAVFATGWMKYEWCPARCCRYIIS